MEKTLSDLQLKPTVLPDTKLDLIEQFDYALQNRDAIGMYQLIDKDDLHTKWGNRKGFISMFIGHYEKIDKKYGGVYVQTVPGNCGRETCKQRYCWTWCYCEYH